MFVGNPCASGVARPCAIIALALAGLLPVAAEASVVPVDFTLDQYDLAPAESLGAGLIDAQPAPLPLASVPRANAAPIIVPLPPPLASGLLGLGAMAVLRVRRRVYQRRW